jgi:uncharacterized protein YaaW (UPF0174 family)
MARRGTLWQDTFPAGQSLRVSNLQVPSHPASHERKQPVCQPLRGLYQQLRKSSCSTCDTLLNNIKDKTSNVKVVEQLILITKKISAGYRKKQALALV